MYEQRMLLGLLFDHHRQLHSGIGGIYEQLPASHHIRLQDEII